MTKGRKHAKPTLSRYKPEFCQQVIEHMKGGNSFTSFCATIADVAPSTGYRWVQNITEFYEAKLIADAFYQKWWEDVGRKGMVGQIKGFQSAVWIFTMKNRFGWSDKLDAALGDKSKKQVQSLTDKELMDKVLAIKAKGEVKK